VLGAWRVTGEPEKLRINLGSLVSGRHQEVYARLLTPPSGGEKSLTFTADVSAVDQDDHNLKGSTKLELLFGTAEEVRAASEHLAVLQRFAIVDISNTATEALKHERRGDRKHAYDMMNTAINLNLRHLTPEQREEYERMAIRMNRGMDEHDRKLSHQQTYLGKQRRDENENR